MDYEFINFKSNVIFCVLFFLGECFEEFDVYVNISNLVGEELMVGYEVKAPIIIPPLQWSWKGLYWFHFGLPVSPSVRLPARLSVHQWA